MPNVIRPSYSALIRSIVGYSARQASHSKSRNSTRFTLPSAAEVNRYASSVRTAVDCAARSAFSLSARIGSTVMNVISATANTAIRAADIFMLLDTAVHLYLPSNS
ncbi:hypothetical protein [Rhodococcus qingshengii]|uniref:hypothetical protein n=1 Tax=Rhodococcus qingshengii TaxID=334542 RepID=UPI003CC8342A